MFKSSLTYRSIIMNISPAIFKIPNSFPIKITPHKNKLTRKDFFNPKRFRSNCVTFWYSIAIDKYGVHDSFMIFKQQYFYIPF